MSQVAIIDYGVGNLRSVEKAFAATGCEAIVTGDEAELRNAQRLVLPGVGAFGACMKALSERGFDRLVREKAREGTPLLGVCVGMQLLFDESDEFGATPGLDCCKDECAGLKSISWCRKLVGTGFTRSGRISCLKDSG